MTNLVCTPEEFLAAPIAERRKLVVAQIDLTPELHDQGEWAVATECGTVCCAAGWAVTLAGGVFEAPPENMARDLYFGAVVDGVSSSIERHAQRLLGLDHAEVEQVFFEAGDRDEVADALLELD